MRNAFWRVLPAVAAVGLPAGAQQAAGEIVECTGQRVSSIEVSAHPPFAPTSSRLFARAARLASKLHEKTRPSVVRRYLAVHQGQPCTELRRTESERILRAQPFIADATVIAYADGPGAVKIVVTTVDEVSLILDGSVSSSSPHLRAVRVGESNLFGGGVYTALRWEDGRGFRDGYQYKLAHYQLFGRPYQLTLQGARRPVGDDWAIEASHPYLTDLQRISWAVAYGRADEYAYFRRPADTSVALFTARNYGSIGGLIRLGDPGLLALVGGSLSHEQVDPDTAPVIISPGVIAADTSSVLRGRYRGFRQTRANALLGFRDIRFLQAVGFDALDAIQDIRQGVQFSAVLGKGLKALDSKSDAGTFAGVNLYGGLGSPASFLALDAAVEARRPSSEVGWSDVLSSARAVTYLRPFPRHTLIATGEWSGGWKMSVPFQLTFASRDGGLRGFHASRLAGGRRFVTRVEDRYVWGRFKQYATIGLAAFADAGKLWAGDAPYGTNTNIHASAGVSVLAAIPPRSQRLVRLDFALPINSERGRGWEVRLNSRDARRLIRREPSDVRRVRERSVPVSVFNWP